MNPAIIAAAIAALQAIITGGLELAKVAGLKEEQIDAAFAKAKADFLANPPTWND